MPITILANKHVSNPSHENWVRIDADKAEGGTECIYNGYQKPPMPYREITTIVDLGRDFGKAACEVSIVDLMGKDMGTVRLSNTSEEVIAAFDQAGLPLPTLKIGA